MNHLNDTICALSTAPGRSGIAVVRISGGESISTLRRVFLPHRPIDEFPARAAVLGSLVDRTAIGELDQALATVFPGPHSYTGEDLVEISLHGSPVLVAALLELLCKSGARLADPGEFTLRAFLNGRMDLAQAEAVRDVIESTTLFQAQTAARQRSGALSSRLRPVKKALTDIVVQLESSVEFVEEDLSLDSRDSLQAQLGTIVRELEGWLDEFRRGRVVREGFSMAVVGRPNVGKSSIFNALLAQERSIVTDLPGTTRDLVSEVASLDGIPVRLVDTAGVCGSALDEVERLGVDRSFKAIADSDAILLVVDGSRPPSPEDRELRREVAGLSCIMAMNKADLSVCWEDAEKRSFAGEFPWIEVSAKTGEGIGGLKRRILDHLFGDSGNRQDGILVTNVRHAGCIQAADENLAKALEALRQEMPEEFVLFDLHRALRELGAITGETQVEDILTEIFSKFCVGK